LEEEFEERTLLAVLGDFNVTICCCLAERLYALTNWISETQNHDGE